jgi:hypothetical protein
MKSLQNGSAEKTCGLHAHQLAFEGTTVQTEGEEVAWLVIESHFRSQCGHMRKVIHVLGMKQPFIVSIDTQLPPGSLELLH